MNYQMNPDFPHRYICPEKLFFFLQHNYGSSAKQIGSSVLGKPIYKYSFGNGNVRILAWSQMHGNETGGTLAMLDLLEMLKTEDAARMQLEGLMKLDFIFMLNPDGAAKWSRRNAIDIDLNRDFHRMSAKETYILKAELETGNYDYALNLHDQRTIFSTDGEHPATLSFLAPSENVERTVTETRKKTMAVISEIYSALKDGLPHGIGRYTDEFYPTSTGDNLTKLGIPTILFEGGHFADDYLRKNTRKFYCLALYAALKACAKLNGSTHGWKRYSEMPENNNTHYDIVYRNVKLNTDFECVLDIAVQYQEVILPSEEEISFVPIVVEVGDVSRKKGWKDIDCTGKFFSSPTKYPKLDAEVNFTII